jgi:uncharacterized protein
MNVKQPLTALIAGFVFISCHAAADQIRVNAAPDINIFNVPTISYAKLRFQTVMRQQYDFSCGSAALASLLTYHYKRPHSEEDVFEAMYRVGDQASIQKLGFSLLDMKTYLASIGMSADGYQVSLDKLEELQLPAITLIELKGYKHFVIIKGIIGDRVLIGDPALGVRTMTRKDFETVWSGIVLLVRTDIAVAQSTFNSERDWAAQGVAPIHSAMSLEDIGGFLNNIRPAGIF